MQTAECRENPKNWVNGQLYSKSVCFHPEDLSNYDHYDVFIEEADPSLPPTD